MPTGYTVKLNDGEQSFEEFVWQCAKAFGAFVLMRDDPMGAPVPKRFEPSSYYRESLDKAIREHEYWSSLDAEGRRLLYDAHVAASAESYAQREAEIAARRVRYDDMVKRIVAWEAPSAEHAGLRSFMLEQLRTSIDYDCSSYGAPEVATLEAWCGKHDADLANAVTRAKRSLAEEQERTDLRNRWVDQLRASVPVPASMLPKESESP